MAKLNTNQLCLGCKNLGLMKSPTGDGYTLCPFCTDPDREESHAVYPERRGQAGRTKRESEE